MQKKMPLGGTFKLIIFFCSQTPQGSIAHFVEERTGFVEVMGLNPVVALKTFAKIIPLVSILNFLSYSEKCLLSLL